MVNDLIVACTMEAVEVANSLLHLSSNDQQSFLEDYFTTLINTLVMVTWMALMTPILKWT